MAAKLTADLGVTNPIYPAIAPFEFSLSANLSTIGPVTCGGGGGSASIAAGKEWRIVLDVNGCKMIGLADNVSGDALRVLGGPRWTPMAAARWNPYVELLFGVTKFSEEEIYPSRQAYLESLAQANGQPAPQHEDYTRQTDTTGFSLAAGAGLDMNLNPALALRLGRFEYIRIWVSNPSGPGSNSNFEFSTGVVLRMGTW